MYKKNMVKAKIILCNSTKENLITHVSELQNLKEMFEALTRLYESKTTGKKLLMRHRLRNVLMDKSDQGLTSSYWRSCRRERARVDNIDIQNAKDK